jgi:hypothetical protein
MAWLKFRRTAWFLGLLALVPLVPGCPPSSGPIDPNTLEPLVVILNVTPAQQAGPDSYMRFSWADAESAADLEVVESNFLTAPLWQRDTTVGGYAVARISLQNRAATVAHYTIKVRDENGRTAETTTLVPVGPAVNTAPHPTFGHTVSRVAIVKGATVADPITFDAGQTWDEQDGQTPLQFRWDLDGDGAYDSDWSSAMTLTHAYTREEALRGEHITDTEDMLHPAPMSGAYQVYVLLVTLEVRDTGGLTATKVSDVEVDLYD